MKLKRLVATILLLVLSLGILPTTSFAVDVEFDKDDVTWFGNTWSTGVEVPAYGVFDSQTFGVAHYQVRKYAGDSASAPPVLVVNKTDSGEYNAGYTSKRNGDGYSVTGLPLKGELVENLIGEYVDVIDNPYSDDGDGDGVGDSLNYLQAALSATYAAWASERAESTSYTSVSNITITFKFANGYTHLIGPVWEIVNNKQYTPAEVRGIIGNDEFYTLVKNALFDGDDPKTIAVDTDTAESMRERVYFALCAGLLPATDDVDGSYIPAEAWNGDRYKSIFETAAQRQENMQRAMEAMVSDSASAESPLEKVRWVGVQLQGGKTLDEIAAGLDDGGVYMEGEGGWNDVLSLSTLMGVNLTYYVPSRYNTSFLDLYKSIYYWPDMSSDISSDMYDNHDTGAATGSATMTGPASANVVELQSALSQLMTIYANNSEELATTNALTAARNWGLRMKAAVGMANGLVSADVLPEYLRALSIGLLDTPSYAVLPPVSWIGDAGDESLYTLRRPGITATTAIAQELSPITYTLVNSFAQFVTDENTSFRSKSDEILAMRNLHEALTWFNDPNLWQAWYEREFDTREGEDHLCLADIYDYLTVHNAFGIVDDYTANPDEPFSSFFGDGVLSSDMKTGISASAGFLPMRTNLYDPNTWKGSVESEWLLNFYSKFGYFRKVLYIDTNADAASNYANTSGRGTLQVATLSDLLQDRDVVLYIDDNLYNVDDIGDIVGKSWDRMGQEAASNSLGVFDSLAKAVTGLWEVSMEELAKSSERVTYSTRVGGTSGNKWDKFFLPLTGVSLQDAEEVTVIGGSSVEANEDSIETYLTPDDLYDGTTGKLKDGAKQTTYTPLFGFAALSGVYRDMDVKNTLNSVLTNNTPVFISSDTAPFISDRLRTSIYNYMLLQNLEAQMPVDYAVGLDMTSPIYMDVFGNILTESGYVVVPAAANATLWNPRYYAPYNAALVSSYGDEFYLPYQDIDTAEGVNGMLEQLFVVQDKKWVLRSMTTVDGEVDISRLSTASNDSLKAIADTFAYELSTDNYLSSVGLWQMLITEVLRGAPIEHIDKQFEGIQTNVTYTRQGLIVADKLEALVDAIAPAGQNASIAIPNPAYIDGIEIIVFFLYKLLILAVLIIWMVNIYLDATGGTIGLATAGKCIGVVVLVMAMVVGIPKIFELTYYESNKLLLQKETEYLMMLNLEKEQNGEEIGVSSVSVPETNTNLYLHLADVEMPWWNLFSSLTISSGYKSLDEMYEQYENQHPLAFSDQAVTKNGSIYISTDTLFKSATVTFSPVVQVMYVTGADDTPASYYTPYYYFLDTIVDEISYWSTQENYIAYTTKIQRGGELKSLGYCKGFFESDDFIEEGGDLFGLYKLYDVPAPRQYPYLAYQSLTQTEWDQLQNSQWCNREAGTQGIIDRIEKLNLYAQEWVANNRAMIGKVSDETFLKCFALSCAMEHNRLFNTQRADYLEIQELSNEDLLRLSIADHNDVMSNSSMSYARFVYTQGGTVAVYVAAVLELINFISSWVKPAVTLLVFVIACLSIFVLKLILRRGNNSIYGYIVTIFLMCSVNILGALFTKLSMYIPSLGFSPTVCMLIQIVVQIAYIFLQVKIVTVALKDWQNVGFQQHESAFNRIKLFNRNDNLSKDVATPKASSGQPYYDRFYARQQRRLRKS